MNRKIYALVLAAALVACQRDAKLPDPPSVHSDAPEAAAEAIPESGIRLPLTTLAALERELGKGKVRSSEAIANRHVPGQTDHVVHYTFSGVEAVIYETQDKSAFVMSVRIYENRYLATPIIGSSREEVREAWGAPSRIEILGDQYLRGDPDAEVEVVVLYQRDQVESVVFKPYFD